MSQLLPYLLILACPVSMGLMMWYMMRHPKGMHGMQGTHSGQQGSADARIERLEQEIKMLRAAHDQAAAAEERPAS